MNSAGIRAIKNALANAEDNLYRAKRQSVAMPDWVSGNGVPIASLIADYQKEVDDLKAALTDGR